MRRLVLAHVPGDIGQLEELAPCVAPTQGAACRTGVTVGCDEIERHGTFLLGRVRAIMNAPL